MSSVRVLRCTCLEVLARFSASQIPWTHFDGVRSATLLTFPMSERKVHFSVSYSLLSRLTFFDCLDNKAYMSNYWWVFEIQIHALWRQNRVGRVQWMLEKFLKVPSRNGDLYVMKCQTTVNFLSLNSPSTYAGMRQQVYHW